MAFKANLLAKLTFTNLPLFPLSFFHRLPPDSPLSKLKLALGLLLLAFFIPASCTYLGHLLLQARRVDRLDQLQPQISQSPAATPLLPHRSKTASQANQNLTGTSPTNATDPTHTAASATNRELTTAKPIKIMFGGDVMFDRYIRQTSHTHPRQYSYPLLDLQPLLRQQDLVVVNLEGPITNNASLSLGSKIGSQRNYIFTFDPAVASALNQANIKLVNLGNNHILNFGQTGLSSTLQYLEEAGIDYFGQVSPKKGLESSKSAKTPSLPSTHLYQKSGLTLALVSFNQFAPIGPQVAFKQTVHEIERLSANSKSVARQELELTPDQVPNQSKAAFSQLAPFQPDLIFVYAHWGNEYAPQPNQAIINQAQQLIAAGADLVVGAHPHVVQPADSHQGCPIYYSLGNLVFDQYFSPEVKRGQLLQVVVEPGSTAKPERKPNSMLESSLSTRSSTKPEITTRTYAVELKENGQTVLVRED